MQSVKHKLEHYKFFARGSYNLEYGMIIDPIAGPELILPKIIGQNRIMEEVNRQVPELYLPDLVLNEGKKSGVKIGLNESGLYFDFDNTKVIRVGLSNAALFEGLFTPMKQRVNGQKIYATGEDAISAHTNRIGSISKNLETHFWNVLENLAPDCQINYISLTGDYSNLEPKFNEYSLGLLKKDRLEKWAEILKELYNDYEIKFSALKEMASGLKQNKEIHVEFILNRTCQNKSELLLISDIIHFSRIVKLYNEHLNASELQKMVDELRFITLPKIEQEKNP